MTYKVESVDGFKAWKIKIGHTLFINAAHDGLEQALV
jgi:hypothetical protein